MAYSGGVKALAVFVLVIAVAFVAVTMIVAAPQGPHYSQAWSHPIRTTASPTIR